MTPEQAFDAPEQEFVVEEPEDTRFYTVLSAGNWLSDKEMRYPTYRLGGKLFMEQFTVPNHIVATCQITRLKKAYRPYPEHRIEPKSKGRYQDHYVLTNQWNAKDEKYEDVEIGYVMVHNPLTGNKEKQRNGMFYKAITPAKELGNIVGNESGVVLVYDGDDQLLLHSPADIKDAQLHYFPNWLDILKGTAQIPFRLRDLEDHIRTRQALAQSDSMRAVGEVYLRSTKMFYDAAKAYTDWQTQIIEETKAHPGGARYDTVAERFFKQLELTRKDNLVEGIARDANDRSSMQETVLRILEQNAKRDQKFDTIVELLAKNLSGKELEGLPPIESQKPAPKTTSEALEELEIGAGFHDMSAVTVPVDEEAAADAEVAKYLGKSGVVSNDVEDADVGKVK